MEPMEKVLAFVAVVAALVGLVTVLMIAASVVSAGLGFCS